MRDLRLYTILSRLPLNYRFKILTMAFIGTHVPLIALSVYFGLVYTADWWTFATTLGLTLAATLAGTGVTLLVLNGLLVPVLKTGAALRAYRERRILEELPAQFTDEVGKLMADAGATLVHLERVRDSLEHIDAATGLPNRRRLAAIVAARAALGAPFAVAAVRFANLARIVEAADANAGDAAMATLADRMQAIAPAGTTFARVSPGTLAMVAGEWDGDATAALRALCQQAVDEIAVGELAICPELYAGLTAYPADDAPAESLIDHAVSAALAANADLPVVHHSPSIHQAAIARLGVENELRRALAGDEFRLFYQPVVDLGSGVVRGAEALIRWQHPRDGLVSPARFVPVAEACGLIDPIGLWVVRESCRQIARWNEEGHHGLKVAVNLSARQFLDPSLSASLREALGAARIDPSQLEIELTESVAMTDQNHTKRVFTALRDLGITIAIDDFGTGYASISYLRRLPFDKLKIDREFVTNVHTNRQSQAICEALVALCRGLGLEALAEGTEQAEEVLHLREIGCALFQGYYFAKPMPSDDFARAASALAEHALLAPGAFAPLRRAS